VGMLCCQFECVLGHDVLRDIVFMWLGSVNKLLCLVKGGIGIHHILPRCG
jgi:hypothetical protein